MDVLSSCVEEPTFTYDDWLRQMRLARQKAMGYYNYLDRIYAHVQEADQLDPQPDKIVYLLTLDVDALIFDVNDNIPVREQWRLFVASQQFKILSSEHKISIKCLQSSVAL